jgi:hypothetical protein
LEGEREGGKETGGEQKEKMTEEEEKEIFHSLIAG